MLVEGKNNVCKKNDSHWPWWFEIMMTGEFGIFDRPFTAQSKPHKNLKSLRIKLIQKEAIFDKILAETKG